MCSNIIVNVDPSKMDGRIRTHGNEGSVKEVEPPLTGVHEIFIFLFNGSKGLPNDFVPSSFFFSVSSSSSSSSPASSSRSSEDGIVLFYKFPLKISIFLRSKTRSSISPRPKQKSSVEHLGEGFLIYPLFHLADSSSSLDARPKRGSLDCQS